MTTHKRFNSKSVPLGILLLLVLSFGLLIPWLGFYFDDWPVITAARLVGPQGYWDFYSYDRPFSAWTFILTIPLLGTRPFIWHIFTIFIRWLTVLGMWWCLRALWPRQERAVTWAALLFAIYPLFDQQPISVAYSQHWICFALYFLSLGLMIQSLRRPRWFWPLTALSLLTAALHLWTMEYFFGLELLRPAVLWLLVSEKEASQRKRAVQTARYWAPYLVLLAVYAAWRVFFLKLAGNDPNRPDLLINLFTQPFATVLHLVQLGLQDFLNILFGAWYRTVDPTKFDLTDKTVLAAVVVGAAAAGLAWFYLNRLQSEPQPQGARENRWYRQALAIGLVAILLGPLPVWLTDRFSLTGMYGSRFALASMFGGSLLVTGLLEWLTPRRLPKLAVVALLVGLAVQFHLQTGVVFYRAWERQKDFYWQLLWRAPYLQPGTSILSQDELFPYMGRASTGLVLNLLYPHPTGTPQLNYWFFELPHDVGMEKTLKLGRGREMDGGFRSFTFTGSSLDSLAIFYKPGAGRCLWVLSPADAGNPEIPEMTRLALPVSNFNRIAAEAPIPGYPPAGIFGTEVEHGWCYYYQKAELARQLGDWQGVLELEKQTQAAGYAPQNPFERLPFIEAQAMSGQWDKARAQTLQVFQEDPAAAARLCSLWAQVSTASPVPTGQAGEHAALLEQLQCQK